MLWLPARRRSPTPLKRWPSRATTSSARRPSTASGLSKKELQKRLVQKGESEEDAEEAISWLEDLHLIDDLETAKQLVRSAALRGYGRARAKNILYEKGIPKEFWEEALEELPEMDGAIDTFLRRKLEGKPLDDKLIKKTVDALLRRGHSYHDIQEGLRRFEAALPEDTWEDTQ